jgi:hypothetical protein
MNKAKVIATLDALPEDKWIKGKFHEDGNFCAVGWLLHEAGVSGREIDMADASTGNAKTLRINMLRGVLLREYDVNYYDRKLILSINDSAPDLDTIKRAIEQRFL